jgi:hypothetical protein
VDSVRIGLTSSNRVTFAENSTGSGSAWEPTTSGCIAEIHPVHRSTRGYIDSEASC